MSVKLDNAQKVVLAVMRQLGGEATIDQIAEKIRVPHKTARDLIGSLPAKMITRTSGMWEESRYKIVDQEGDHA